MCLWLPYGKGGTSFECWAGVFEIYPISTEGFTHSFKKNAGNQPILGDPGVPERLCAPRLCLGGFRIRNGPPPAVSLWLKEEKGARSEWRGGTGMGHEASACLVGRKFDA